MALPTRALVTGLDGFTGRHLRTVLEERGIEVIGLRSNLLDREGLQAEVLETAPDYVLHLAAIAFAADERSEAIYSVNVIGSVNLLDALTGLAKPPEKVVLASSATVYGATEKTRLDESICPRPVSHYGCSKLSMENLAMNYFDRLPILITRPFNYTGTGQGDNFLIPKIITAYVEGSGVVELGNLDVSREFNDVRDVCDVYGALLESSNRSEVLNICTGRTVALSQLISILDELSGTEIEVVVNPAFVRENEIKDLSGCPTKLQGIVGDGFRFGIGDTLEWMYRFERDRGVN